MEIINVNHGIGNCFVDGKIKWIEINRNLRDYPGLYKSVLKHEKKHYNFKKESQHFLHDLKVTGLISILSKVNLILLLTALFIPHFLSAMYIPSLKTEKALILAITSTLSIIIAMFLIAGSINISSVMG